MKKRRLFGSLLLVVTAFIWGLGFPMQSMALEHIGAATLTCVRNVIAGFFLLALIPLFDKKSGRRLIVRTEKGVRAGFTRRELLGGVLCGILLGTATTLQQLGISSEETDSGKAAFITALYMVIVPLLGLFRRRFPSRRVFLSVALAVLGSYFLTANIVFSGTGIGGFFSSLVSSVRDRPVFDRNGRRANVLYSVFYSVAHHASRDADRRGREHPFSACGGASRAISRYFLKRCCLHGTDRGTKIRGSHRCDLDFIARIRVRGARRCGSFERNQNALAAFRVPCRAWGCSPCTASRQKEMIFSRCQSDSAFFSKRVRSASNSSGKGEEKLTRSPLVGWTKEMRSAWSACPERRLACFFSKAVPPPP